MAVSSIFGAMGMKALVQIKKIVADRIIDMGGGTYKEIDNSVNNVTVNIQNIANAFSTLLSGEASTQAYLEAFGYLPSVRTFIPKDGRNLLSDKIENLQDKIDVLYMLEDECDEDARYEAETAVDAATAEIEEITVPAEQSLVGASLAAAMTSTDFFKVTNDRWEDLIGIGKAELEQRLPPEFVTSLGFAVMLHNVFEISLQKTKRHRKKQRPNLIIAR